VLEVMPYKSQAQQHWAHTPEGMKKLGPKKVKEFDRMSKGMKLPSRVTKPKPRAKKGK